MSDTKKYLKAKEAVKYKYLKQQLYTWTYEKIVSSPKKFGGDFSNSAIMYEYLLEFYSDEMVIHVEQGVMSILATVSRMKNKILEKNPQYDYRIKHKPRTKLRKIDS